MKEKKITISLNILETIDIYTSGKLTETKTKQILNEFSKDDMIEALIELQQDNYEEDQEEEDLEEEDQEDDQEEDDQEEENQDKKHKQIIDDDEDYEPPRNKKHKQIIDDDEDLDNFLDDELPKEKPKIKSLSERFNEEDDDLV